MQCSNDECDFYHPDWRCQMAEIGHQTCPKCDSALQQDWIAKLRTVTVETEDNFVEGGLGTHYNIHTGTEQTRAEYKKWEEGIKRKAKEQGREVIIGKDKAGPRNTRGEKIADDISRHGKKAIDHYRLESKRKQMEEKVAREERVS